MSSISKLCLLLCNRLLEVFGLGARIVICSPRLLQKSSILAHRCKGNTKLLDTVSLRSRLNRSFPV